MKAIQKVLDQIREDEVVALTRDLVRIPSVYRPRDPDAVRREIEGLCRRVESAHPGTKAEWEPLGALRPPTKVAREEPLVRALGFAVRKVTGKAPRYGGVPGSTDGTILHTDLGIPFVTCGPGNRLIPHQVDEYVEIGELTDAAGSYAVAAFKFLEGAKHP